MAQEIDEISLGDWDGLSFDRVKELYPQEFLQRGQELTSCRPAGGENFYDLQRRVLPFFRSVLENAQQPVLIVGHAGVNRVILGHIRSVPLETIMSIEQDYGCLNIIEKAAAGVRIIAENLKSGVGV